MKNYFFILLNLLLVLLFVYSAKDEDKVDHWIDWQDYTYTTYSGVLQADDNGNAFIHYVFLESMNNATTDPVVLWLQGGPGCSSLLGMISEIGPWVFVNDNSTLQNNTQYAWNKNASLLFFESPVGVGFSYNTTEIQLDDNTTAQYSMTALSYWFSNFSEYRANNFWIAGESYAGMYIPFLADLILTYNANPGIYKINLQGLLIGNGVFDYNSDLIQNYSAGQFVSRQFVNLELNKIFQTSCQADMYGPGCQYFYQQLNQITNTIKVTNIYDYTYTTYMLQSKKMKHLQLNTSPYTIIDDYFNNPDLKSLIHVDPSIQFQLCSMNVLMNYSGFSSSIGFYQRFFANNLKILIYSGLSDADLPFQYTRHSIVELMKVTNLKLVTDQSQWKTQMPSQQMPGFVEYYNCLLYTSPSPRDQA
eukprot:TRINITY_DN3436_c0_g1_i4.p1 TRINITY_DN3436_c0_g1~~TRINITY_DN3436_c0_g1_i4.p1  ORF type:complete len:418 (-),score=52.41 TRINITY_DN3436_c0_g1_i4:77-1330(-)